jgi:GNAT superfamily N-acetyltransferase
VLAGAEAVLGQEAEPHLSELERIEAQALADAVTRAGGRSALVGGATCVAHPGIPVMELNRAIPVAATVDVAAIADWFEAPHAMCVPPERRDLARELDEHGYTHASSWMKFARDAAPARNAETELHVEQTLDAELFGPLVAEGSSIPPEAAGPLAAIVGAPGWSCFVAWAGAEPAGSGALYVDGTNAWIGVASTLPQYRRRGAQTALLAARIDAARAAGAVSLVTETGERIPGEPDQSYRNILRAGFREAYLRANWRSPE